MTSLDRAGSVFDALGGKVGFVGLLDGSEAAEVSVLSVGADARTPLPVKEVRAERARCAVTARPILVLHVERVANFAQVGDAVVGTVAVDMVKEARREHAVHVKPREAMRLVRPVVHVDVDVAGLVGVAGNAASQRHAATHQPRKRAGLRVIAQKFFQPILRQFHVPIPVFTSHQHIIIQEAV